MRIEEVTGLKPSEELRVKLVKEEIKMRKKQPPAWTRKYRRLWLIRRNGNGSKKD